MIGVENQRMNQNTPQVEAGRVSWASVTWVSGNVVSGQFDAGAQVSARVRYRLYHAHSRGVPGSGGGIEICRNIHASHCDGHDDVHLAIHPDRLECTGGNGHRFIRTSAAVVGGLAF